MRLDQWRALRPLLGRTSTSRSRSTRASCRRPRRTRATRSSAASSRTRSRRPAGVVGHRRGQPERVRGRPAARAAEAADGPRRAGPLREGVQRRGQRRAGRTRARRAEGRGRRRVVFNFVDLLTHGRSESAILMEVARDVEALRSPDEAVVRAVVRAPRAARGRAAGVTTVLTTDHGSILCERPLTVLCAPRRDEQPALQVRAGPARREPGRRVLVNDEKVLRFPPGRLATNYLFALEDFFFVYPTKLREYQARYRGSFLHGGVSPEEMILPLWLTLRTGQGADAMAPVCPPAALPGTVPAAAGRRCSRRRSCSRRSTRSASS
jgi:hypothetical protein